MLESLARMAAADELLIAEASFYSSSPEERARSRDSVGETCPVVKRPVPLLGVNRDGPPNNPLLSLIMIPIKGIMTVGHI